MTFNWWMFVHITNIKTNCFISGRFFSFIKTMVYLHQNQWVLGVYSLESHDAGPSVSHHLYPLPHLPPGSPLLIHEVWKGHITITIVCKLSSWNMWNITWFTIMKQTNTLLCKVYQNRKYFCFTLNNEHK